MRSTALLLLLTGLAACRRDPPPPPAEPAPSASASSAPAAGVQILEQGREPRALVTFAFVPGRKEARVLAVDSHLELKDQPRVDEQVELRFDVEYPAADSVTLTLRHAEATAADIPHVESTVGAVFRQRFGKDGAADPPQASFPPSATGAARQYVEGAVTQLASAFLPAFPSTPVGEGARWRWGAGDSPIFELKERRDDRLVVTETLEIRGPRPVDRGKVIDVSEDHALRIEAPRDGIARHVESTVVADRKKGTKRTTHLRFDVLDGGH